MVEALGAGVLCSMAVACLVAIRYGYSRTRQSLLYTAILGIEIIFLGVLLLVLSSRLFLRRLGLMSIQSLCLKKRLRRQSWSWCWAPASASQPDSRRKENGHKGHFFWESGSLKFLEQRQLLSALRHQYQLQLPHPGPPISSQPSPAVPILGVVPPSPSLWPGGLMFPRQAS